MAPSKPNPRVFLEVAIDNRTEGTITIELFMDEAPLTAKNFLYLCTGKSDAVDSEGKPLSFKDSIIHRVIPGAICHGGDFERGNGTGGGSIYGDKFPDVETPTFKHIKGSVTTAHAMPRCPKKVMDAGEKYSYICGSQFFICVDSTPWLDMKHLVFGKVVEGIKVVEAISEVGSRSGTTTKVVKIVNCGRVN